MLYASRKIDGSSWERDTIKTAVFPFGFPNGCPSVVELETKIRHAKELEIVEVDHGK